MMTLGQKIAESRRKKGWTLSDLAQSVDLSISGIRKIETDQLKGGPDDDVVLKIADALGDSSILTHALRVNPIFQRVIPERFSRLNHIKKDPSAIFEKLKEEFEEGREAAGILARIFAHADPTNTPNFREIFFANLEQVLDVMRGGETLFAEMIEAGLLTEEDQREVHARQQAKCERNGHHRPEKGSGAVV